MERNYDFRKEMLMVHRPDLRCEYTPGKDEVSLENCTILVKEDAGEVITTAALDFQEYLFTSMQVTCALSRKGSAGMAVTVGTYTQLGKAWNYDPVAASYEITVSDDGVTVCGYDDRGCAQGLYQLEDRMNHIRAPYLAKGVTHYAPAFSPRMVHSGYGQEIYPDQHLAAIAHAGMDAILLFVKDVDLTQVGYLDFNNTIRRANKYGIDVYAYSKMESNMHPDDPGAFAHYNSTYGKLFENCPGFKGVVLVGESVEFPSKDPRVSPFKHNKNTIDGIPTGKPTAGWFPCMDYPQWLQMLQKVIYPHKPDADIVFWTYNWGKESEELRLKLIDSLPEGISLMATFEMSQVRQMDGYKCRAADYTISFPEAGPYFISEAKRAKERGIRLYTQANSAGLTWDYGVIPYDPFPLHWERRYKAMLEAREKWGLSGIMESHHFGYWPSFISAIEKRMFTLGSRDNAVEAIAEELYGKENVPAAMEAWGLLSQAHEHYPCTNEDQYGPFRIGPAYPFVLESDAQIPTVPYAIHGGNRITYVDYGYSPVTKLRPTGVGHLQIGFRQLRIGGEIRDLEKMRVYLQQAREKLEALATKLEGYRKADCLRLCNMIAFMENTATTAIHAKKWAINRWKFYSLTQKDEIEKWVQEMEEIGEAEICNAEATIPLVQKDSRLGWEPSMEYIGDERHLRWKIRQLRYVIDGELGFYRRMIAETL